ncbi:MAG: ABC transporter ATP-binding protein [Desulfocapsaceae bacterium]|nr:ABC transporter ATP-binding protein [Desulfocapsaceae bacterium]
MTEKMIEAKNVAKTYDIEERTITVLEEIDLEIDRAEFVVIAGSSGSGKTTLLSLLSGLDSPSRGTVKLAGRDITTATEDELAPLRNELIGFVFQAFYLVPSLNALENVMFPAELKHDTAAREKAEALLDRAGLWSRRRNRPEQLSGGEKQRVAICRALVNSPKLLFADEPTGNLDAENSRGIIRLILELQEEHQATLVMATHSGEIADMADRTLVLRDGRLVQGGAPI